MAAVGERKETKEKSAPNETAKSMVKETGTKAEKARAYELEFQFDKFQLPDLAAIYDRNGGKVTQEVLDYISNVDFGGGNYNYRSLPDYDQLHQKDK